MGWRSALTALTRTRSNAPGVNFAEEEEALAESLDNLVPQMHGFYQIRLQRRFWGWVCTVNSRIPSLPWHFQLYTWDKRPDREKMARLAVGPLLQYMPHAKAHQLAEQILGRDGMEQVLASRYVVKSRLNPQVVYLFTTGSMYLYQNGIVVGSFCLNARGGRYPLWDVVLSRIMMVTGSELEFLRTAYFYGPVPPFFARPMNRNQFGEIFGKENLERWDTYTSSTLEAVTQP